MSTENKTDPKAPKEVPQLTSEDEARFRAKVDDSGGPDACHEWLGTRTGGYGRFWANAESKMIYAHRTAYTIAHGPIPEGLDLLHGCDNKGCVNVNHLRPGTHAENMDDMSKRGRGRGRHVSPTQRTTIRRLYAKGRLTQAQIADRFGISQAWVSKLVRP